MGGHSHRSGTLRQSNKRNKRSLASKRSQARRTGAGKVESTKRSLKHGTTNNAVKHNKANRAHMAQQKRDMQRRQRVLESRMGGGGIKIDHPPKVTGIISLSDPTEAYFLEESLRDVFLKGSSAAHQSSSSDVLTKDGKSKSVSSSVTCRFDAYKKKKMTFLTNSTAFPSVLSDDCSDRDRDDAAVLAALDLCRVCDCIMFVLDGTGALAQNSSNNDDSSMEDMLSERGDRILIACKAQGMPTTLTVLGFNQHSPGSRKKMMKKNKLKRRNDVKKYAQRFAKTEFGDGAKLIDLDIEVEGVSNDTALDEDEEDENLDVSEDEEMMDDSNEADKTVNETNQDVNSTQNSAIIRTLCNMAVTPSKWTEIRPYLVSNGGCGEGYSYVEDTKELKVTGYLRGTAPFDANSLVHVPNLGTFTVKSIEASSPPLSQQRTTSKGAVADMEGGVTDMTESSTVLAVPDPDEREPLERFATPDALDGEQNLIGFDEDAEYGDNVDDENDNEVPSFNGFQKGEARPAGWSDYQSAWLDAVDNDVDEADHGELAHALNAKSSTNLDADMDFDDDTNINEEERRALLAQRRHDHKEDLQFPDEVEVKEDEKAQDRFARYRSLNSFRKSFWDPKENLPDSYGSIYHFASFKATQRDVIADHKDVIAAANSARILTGWTAGKTGNINKGVTNDASMNDDEEEDMDFLEGCVASGTYVTVTIENVPARARTFLSRDSLLCVVGLLPHENKVSALHMGICQTAKCEPGDAPVKSKDALTFRCGWRTWQARPVFSQNNLNSDKHKFERFLPGGAFLAASVLGPVTYTPCPVLMFRESKSDQPGRQLVGVGSMIGADADRIVIKRIVLTGYPTRVHKRHATVKYMFYNPEDVKWFKPAGLTTKHGLQGHIMESNGEHGTMKCLLNKPIKQHDTVCLPLYKRIYPKFAPTEVSTDDEKSTVTRNLVVL